MSNITLQIALQTHDTQLSLISTLIGELNARDVRYCHWKSNLALTESLRGLTDIDLLVDRADAPLFRGVLSDLSFRPAVSMDSQSFPSVEHYYALDEKSGVLVHVHAYYRVITGQSLSKNYHFPIEEMLLQNTHLQDGVPVPVKSAELIVFTLRIMLKHTAAVELLMLSRYWDQVKQEIEWLSPAGTMAESLSLLDDWLPSVGAELFSACVDALKTSAPLFRRILLAHQLRARLRMYGRRSSIHAWWVGVRKFTTMFYRRLARTPKGMVPRSGGAVIAFVGAEASGKSTLLDEIGRWLGGHFAVEHMHVGKPKSTWLTFFPNLLVPTLRMLLPKFRSSRFVTQNGAHARSANSKPKFPLIFVLRSVLLAYDRRAMLRRAFRRAANGTIVLCDRYPSSRAGTPDSPQLAHLPIPRKRYPLRHLLARIENRLYQEMAPPDLVVFLTVPVEVAVERNQARQKTEPEDYVRQRHEQTANLEFEKTSVYKVNTNQPRYKTVLQVKKIIWDRL